MCLLGCRNKERLEKSLLQLVQNDEKIQELKDKIVYEQTKSKQMENIILRMGKAIAEHDSSMLLGDDEELFPRQLKHLFVPDYIVFSDDWVSVYEMGYSTKIRYNKRCVHCDVCKKKPENNASWGYNNE